MNDFVFGDLSVGMKYSFIKKINSSDLEKFSELTGDVNPLHTDEEYAKGTQFGKKVVYGMLVNSFLSTLAGMHIPGKYSLILSVESTFRKPCYLGDVIQIEGIIEKIISATQIIYLKTKIINQKQEILQEGRMCIKVMK